MSNMITFRRDKLKRLIAANRVVLADSYHFDDMLGESRTTNADARCAHGERTGHVEDSQGRDVLSLPV